MSNQTQSSQDVLNLAADDRIEVTEPKPKPIKTLDIAKPKQKKGRKVDWNEAYVWYLGDFTRSYADVAKKFGVAKTTVEAAAKVTLKDGSWSTWAERRQELGETARKKAEEEYKKSVPARNEQHLLQYRNAQVAASQKITHLASEGKWLVDPETGRRIKTDEFDARQVKDAILGLKAAIEGERVILGLATSVSTIKPGEDEKGKGWGDLLALALSEKAKRERETNG